MILHLDMNSYFATVEQQSNPFLRGKPICVAGKGNGDLSRAKSRERTVCAALSIEAKKYGLKSGAGVWEAKKLCPDIIVVQADYAKYQYISQKVFAIMESYSPDIEVFSIDEAFADISNHISATPGVEGKGFKDAIPIAMEMKARIREEVGDYLKCSIGVAPNKLLAKLASEMVKPDGLTIIEPKDLDAVRRKTPIEDLCGIGSRLQYRLNNLGIYTMKELGDFPPKSLIKLFGPHLGTLLHNMGCGIDNSPVTPYYEMSEEKSFGHSYTLPRDIMKIDDAKKVLLKLSEKVGRRMRKAQFMGRTVHLYIRYFDRSGWGQRTTLSRYINDGFEIYKAACGLLEGSGRHSRTKTPSLRAPAKQSSSSHIIPSESRSQLVIPKPDGNPTFGIQMDPRPASPSQGGSGGHSVWDDTISSRLLSNNNHTFYSSSASEKFYKPIRLIGISVTNLLHTKQISLPMLPEDKREEQVKKTLDKINDRFGEFTVFRSALVEVKDRIENIPDGRNKRMMK